MYTNGVDEPCFVWDKSNTEHLLERHGIQDFEAEEALLDFGGSGFGTYNRGLEKRYGYLGSTQDGRILAVVYTERGGCFRVVTARDAKLSEKRRYRKGKR